MPKKPMGPKRSVPFQFYKGLIRIGIKRSEFVYLGEKPTNGAIIVSNHVGTSAPLAWELYGDIPTFRFWGASEMNGSLPEMYKYHTEVYFHGKKHWNIHLARLYCLAASPLTYIFYKGLNLISTYHDMRIIKTIKESIKTLNEGQNIIIFPEVSDKGYLDELEGFHQGFLMLAELCYKRGMDLPVYVSYYRKSERKYIVDSPVMLSEIFGGGADREEIAKMLCERCNNLGRLSIENLLAAKTENTPEGDVSPEVARIG